MQVLLLNSRPDDKALIETHLSKSFSDYQFVHTHDKVGYLTILDEQSPSIILAGTNVPGYSIFDALEDARKSDPFLPFIIIGRSNGADDVFDLLGEHACVNYVELEDLNRLDATIKKEINSSKVNRELYHSDIKLSEKRKELNRLSLVARYTQFGVIITDSDGYIEWVNESFSTLTGYSLEEVKGKKPGHLLQGENTNSDIVLYIKTCLKEQTPVTVEILNYNKDKIPYWIRLSIAPVTDHNGKLTHYVGIQEDITERKTLQHNLEEQYERIKMAQEFAGVGEWTFNKNTEQIQWSKLMYDLYERDKNLGPPTYPEIFEYYDESDTEKLQVALHKLLEDEAPYELELKVRLSDHYKIIRTVGKPWYDEENQIIGSRGIVQDITNFRSVRESIKTKTHTLETIADNFKGLVIRYAMHPDGSDELLYTSKGIQSVFELSKQRIMWDISPMWNMILDEDLFLMKRSVFISQRDLTPWDHTFRIKTPSGIIKHLRGHGIPIKEEDGTVIWSTIILDETDHHILQHTLLSELEEQDELLGKIHRQNSDIIAAILTMQHLDDSDGHSALQNTSLRLTVLKHVYEALHGSNYALNIDAPQNVMKVIETISGSLNMGESISVKTDITVESLDSNEFLLLALLLYELLKTSSNDGLPNGGAVHIQIHEDENNREHHRFIYQDSSDGLNAPNLHAEADPNGHKVIHYLLARLHADFTFTTNGRYHLSAIYKPNIRPMAGKNANGKR